MRDKPSDSRSRRAPMTAGKPDAPERGTTGGLVVLRTRTTSSGRAGPTGSPTVMTARWIAYRVSVSPEEMLYIADRGDLAASLQQSTVNLTRAYLIWRDTIVEILREEASRLSTP